MASKTQQEVMVLDIGRAGSPAAAPDANYPPRRFDRAGQVVRGSNGSYKEGTVTGEADVESKTSSGRRAYTRLPREALLSPESTHRGIQVTLDNNVMWNEFFRCKTEMILTKQGSRMFPYCRFRISGLQPSSKYVLMMDIQPVDQSRYEWTGAGWEVAGKAERHATSSPFAHPESPTTGQHWMQSPVSFYKLKLTSNVADQEGNAILHPMHRYMPRLHVVQTEKAAQDINLNASNVASFTFQQTEFMAVTAYQNCEFSQLKVHYNPFAKGLREEGFGPPGPRPKSNPDGATVTSQQQPLKKSLKSLLANHKARSACVQGASSGSSPRAIIKNSICNSQPAETLIGDIIREAHISLTRCNVDSLSPSQRLAQTDTKTAPGKPNSQDVHNADKKSTESSGEPPPQGKSGAAHGDQVSGAKCQSEVQAIPSVKRRLPLPALALFLKKHSAKTKTVRSKLDSASTPIPADVQSKTGTVSAKQDSSITEIASESDQNAANVFGKEAFQHVATLPFEDTAASPEAIRSRMNDHQPVSPAPQPGKPAFGQFEESLGNHKTLVCSAVPTSSSSPVLSPLLDTALVAPPVPTGTSSESKCGDFLSDTPCSPFGFESLSHASSPDPLPSLPAAFALDLDSAPSKPCAGLPLSKDPALSVFKWHTVLPLPEPYVHPSFEVFPPTSLGSSLSPSQTLADVPSQSSPLVHSDPPAVHSLSFQESEQPLPFPGELSPLALPLTLSPTFSSLDGDALSPMPSIADLVHFFSTEEHLGMGMEFPNADLATPPCPPDVSGEAHASAHPAHVPVVPSQKPLKGKKKARRRKPAVSDLERKTDDSAYTTVEPNLEEVEEQLFISFTSKEALQLHVADRKAQEANDQLAPSDVHLQQPAREHTHEDTIAALEQVLLKDVKMMKHQQIIHPVLQEVGLKMNLLDAGLSIDLQYLGVRLPIPPPGSSLEPPSQELPPPLQGASGSFVSRTGKTTDVTQIKGWREKFSPSEPSVAPSPPKPEVCVSWEQPKKNLSAFCSDMLDQYLESEAKLIDQRAASFSQPPADSLPVYELPASSSSYVRTLGSVLKKQSVASDLISGFVPPSKRAKAPSRPFKASRKLERKQKSSKSPVNPGLAPSLPTVPDSTDAPRLPAPSAEPPKPKKSLPAVRPSASAPFSSPSRSPPLERKKRVKRDVSAPLRRHSGEEPVDPAGSLKPAMTRALLMQKGLEDDAVWAGQPRTSIAEERASIALTSLFTLKGFVSDNPTAPILLPRRPEPACLNDFCRLGCVCSSLAYTARVGRCGRPQCMLGCSCLKQKVVLLKNLDGSDSSPSSHGGRKRKRKRMKMAYVLKEADSVSQPAERVRTLWKRDSGDSDLEQTRVPEASSSSPRTAVTRLLTKKTGKNASSCARVRRFLGKSGIRRPMKKSSGDSSAAFARKLHRKPKRRKKVRPQKPEGKPLEPAPSVPPLPAPSGSPQRVSEESRPSRRLTILTECRWNCDDDRDHVLQTLCEAMALDRLDKVFWTRKYQINPISQTVEDNSTVHYKVLITTRDEWDSAKLCPVATSSRSDRDLCAQENHPTQQVPSVTAWHREVTEEDFAQDWPQEIDESHPEKESGQVHAGSEQTDQRRSGVWMGLPVLGGVSTAGFLLADKKLPGGGDPIQKRVHNASARVQRQKMSRLVAELRKELRLEDVMSTAATLREAVRAIEELQATEKRLKRKKKVLVRQQERLMDILVPSPRDCGHNRSRTGSQDGVKDDAGQKRNPAIGRDGNPAVAPRPPSPDLHRTPPATVASGRSEGSSGDDVVFVSSVRKLPDERAPPCPAAPPRPAPVKTPGASRDVPALRRRPKMVPNILSRRKTLVPPPVVSDDLGGFRTVVPVELLSVVGAALPGQPFLTLTPLVALPQLPSSSAATEGLNDTERARGQNAREASGRERAEGGGEKNSVRRLASGAGSKERRSFQRAAKRFRAKEKKKVLINIGLMILHEKELKPARGRTRPVFVDPDVTAPDLRKQAVRKMRTFYKDLGEGPYALLYPDRSEVVHVPGTRSPFSLSAYKKELGKAYARITFFICPEGHFRGGAQSIPSVLCSNSASDKSTSGSDSEVVITSRSAAVFKSS
ncbi:MAX dimerization protein MGA a isoform X9 [Syngnathoides biaculeatus]|uniref:MAX dimerization protein MGA a isoform X9 n=1 Tax=Syngnathoides biaculeatus TaxID=300417 RepID=UPI002ADD5E7F|nr:MAX dimerization protein MGA a isoform X9 [Syngnathoides biaculeatus]